MIRHAEIAVGPDPGDPSWIGTSKWNADHFGPKFPLLVWNSGATWLNITPGAARAFVVNSEVQLHLTEVTTVGFRVSRAGSIGNAGRIVVLGNNGAPDAWDYLGNAAGSPGVNLNVIGTIFEADVAIRPSMKVNSVRIRVATEGGSSITTKLYSLQVWAK